MRPSHRAKRSAALFNNNYCCLFHRCTDYNGFIKIASTYNKKSRDCGIFIFSLETFWCFHFNLGYFFIQCLDNFVCDIQVRNIRTCACHTAINHQR